MIMFQKKFTFAISMFALCLVGVNYSTLAQEVQDPRAPYVAINDDDATGIAAVSLVNQLVDTAGMAANFAANAAADLHDDAFFVVGVLGQQQDLQLPV